MDYEGEFDWVELHRGEFPDGARTVDEISEKQFCQQLKALDPHAEVIFNNRRQKWALYRTIFFGATPAGDLLQHQFDLEHPPGSWVLDEMRKRCIIRSGETSMDLSKAKQQAVKDLQWRMGRRQREQDRKWKDCMRDVGGELDSFVRRGKRSNALANRKKTPKRAGWMPLLSA